MTQPPEVILEARSILKRYPGNVALNYVNFRVYRNRINVLIGENGAGKSTLMRILAGVETADEGELLFEGRPVRMASPRDATALGISIVHQELAILTNLDISENIFAGRELTRSGLFVNRMQEDRQANTMLSRLRKPLEVKTPAAELSLGCRQIVELARALAQGSKVLILDEPTSALSSAEAESLFQVMQELKQLGVTIIYISHRLHELLHLGEHFTVLRSGCVVGEAVRADVTRGWIVETMSGRAEVKCANRTRTRQASTALAVRDLSLDAAAGGANLRNISFTVNQGEILGIYGLLGAGRTELLEALAGRRQMNSGNVEIAGKVHRIRSVVDAMNSGIALVPEDRQRDGLVPELSIRENIALASLRGAWLSREKENARVRQLANKLAIAANDLELPVTALSGGNQQKVLLARCLMRSPKVLLLDEPTRGVDAVAKLEIYRLLRQLTEEGLSIVFTSSEIEETQLLADRVLVLCQGRITAEFAGEEATDAALFSAASPTVAVAS
jgi:erythritol transport system ATP-binding protein